MTALAEALKAAGFKASKETQHRREQPVSRRREAPAPPIPPKPIASPLRATPAEEAGPRLPTMQVDKVVAARAANVLAARVMGRGAHWTPDKKITQAHYDAPPMTLPVPETIQNLTGAPFGRFRVVGFLGKTSDGKNAKWKWLVRCACGSYEERSAAAVKNKANAHDCCHQCRHLIYIKREEYRRRTGKELPIGAFV